MYLTLMRIILLKFPTPKNQGICRYNTLQSPVDMGL